MALLNFFKKKSKDEQIAEAEAQLEKETALAEKQEQLEAKTTKLAEIRNKTKDLKSARFRSNIKRSLPGQIYTAVMNKSSKIQNPKVNTGQNFFKSIFGEQKTAPSPVYGNSSKIDSFALAMGGERGSKPKKITVPKFY